MITPAYGLTATERVLPRMALDFTTGVLDSRVTVTRALNTATCVNSSGNIQIVNANLPRFDYNPVTLAPRGLLIEETRVNSTLYSAMTAANWGGPGGTLSNTGKLSPDGSANMLQFTENTSSSAHQMYITPTLPGGISGNIDYTASAYIAAGTRRYVTVQAGTNSNGWGVTVDTLNWTITGTYAVGSTVYKSSSITHVGNNIYRVTVTGQATFAGLSAYVLIGGSLVSNAVASNTTYLGDGSTFFAWGAQLEAGSFATSYIPTTTGAVTRNADVVAMTGTNFSNWWQATTGAMAIRARQLSATSTRPWAYISDGTANNIISLRGNVADPELYIKATTDQVQIDAGTLTANASYGLSGAWNTDSCAAAFNGGAAGTDASATIPTVDRMLIGSDGTNYLSGWAEKISYWPQRITNAETQAFSK